MRNRAPAFEAGVIAQAQRHVGYRAQPQRKSAFQLAGYVGQPWNGTFVDRVLHDAFADFAEVRFLSTVTALSFYVKANRVYQKPRPGDIVFFNFATDPQHAFEQPHVGVVTEVRPDGSFRTVEGETGPGTPQGSQLVDGVFERVRYADDALGFVRPRPQTVNRNDSDEQPKLKMSYFDSNPKTKARAVALVQTALNRATGKKFSKGKANGETKAALGAYARDRGVVENRGEFSHSALVVLADFTDEFQLE